MKKANFWKRMTGGMRAFLILALVFLALGLGTLGSVVSTGDGYALSAKRDSDVKQPAILLDLSAPDEGHGEEGHVHRDLYIKTVYFNLGAIYTEYGDVVKLRIARGNRSDSPFVTGDDIAFANLYERIDEGKSSVNPEMDGVGNWVEYRVPAQDGWRLTTYPVYKVTVETMGATVLINDIVFVANDQDLSAEGSHKPVVLQAAVDKASVLPYDSSRGETIETAIKKAAAVADGKMIPSMAQSSYFRLGPEEVISMMTVSEMRLGKSFEHGAVYHIDTEYNVLGNALLAFGTRLAGMSPFGLRLMPFLASFGVLMFGFFLVRKLTGSDKAGFIFSVLYALCGVSMSLGHFGTPLMIGLFFFTASLYFTVCFFRDGLKEANFKSAAVPLLGGLFAAAAICVNGAYVIPVAGIAALFILGAVRQFRATRAALDTAIGEVEEFESVPENRPSGGEVSEPRKKLVSAYKEHRYKTSVSCALFFSCLILGAFLLSVAFGPAMYYPYVKLYDNPENPSLSIFYFLWKAFAGGFTGNNMLVSPQSPWSFFYILYQGTGTSYAVTAAGSLIAVAALLSGIAGAVFAILSLRKKKGEEGARNELYEVIVLLAGIVIGLVTSSFARGGLAFQMLAYVCLFALAAKGASAEEEGSLGKAVKRVSLVCLFALAVCFGLFAVFTFSIPTTSGFMAGLWA